MRTAQKPVFSCISLHLLCVEHVDMINSKMLHSPCSCVGVACLCVLLIGGNVCVISQISICMGLILLVWFLVSITFSSGEILFDCCCCCRCCWSFLLGNKNDFLSKIKVHLISNAILYTEWDFYIIFVKFHAQQRNERVRTIHAP